MDNLNVVADDVVTNQEGSLRQDVDARDDGFVSPLIIVLGDQASVEITDYEAMDSIEPLPHEAIGLEVEGEPQNGDSSVVDSGKKPEISSTILPVDEL